MASLLEEAPQPGQAQSQHRPSQQADAEREEAATPECRVHGPSWVKVARSPQELKRMTREWQAEAEGPHGGDSDKAQPCSPGSRA